MKRSTAPIPVAARAPLPPGAAERPWRWLLRDLFGFGRVAPAPGAVRVEHRRLFVLPTGQGYAFAATVVAVLVGTINYAVSLGYVVAFLLAGMGLVSALHAHRNLVGLSARTGRARPVFAGDEAVFQVYVEAPAGAPRPSLAVAYRYPSGRREAWREVRFSLAPGESRCLELPRATPHRGRMPLGRLRLLTRYPLGLFRAWSPFELDTACLVYPRPAGDRPLPAPAEPDRTPDVGATGPSEQDFAGLRDYARGDSPRRIHWKVAARGHAVPVKVFRGESGEEVVLRWDEAGPGEVEARLSQLARWVVRAEESGLRYALDLPPHRTPVGRGEDHARRCLTALALFGTPPART